eukprot:scaffold126788_cov63-Phaeocystis_antarctica.AAC.3
MASRASPPPSRPPVPPHAGRAASQTPRARAPGLCAAAAPLPGVARSPSPSSAATAGWSPTRAATGSGLPVAVEELDLLPARVRPAKAGRARRRRRRAVARARALLRVELTEDRSVPACTGTCTWPGWLIEARGVHTIEATAVVTEAAVAGRIEEGPQAHARLLLTPGARLLARPRALHDGVPVQVVPRALLRVAQSGVGGLDVLEVGARNLSLARVLVRVPLRARAHACEQGGSTERSVSTPARTLRAICRYAFRSSSSPASIATPSTS